MSFFFALPAMALMNLSIMSFFSSRDVSKVVVVTVKGTLVHTTCKQGVWGRAPAGYGAEPRRGAGQRPAKKMFGF